MKLDCGPTRAEKTAAREARREAKEAARRQWHKVFVIWPRRVGSHDCRAFETIERREVVVGTTYVGPAGLPYLYPHPVYGWEYRACN